MDLAADVLQVDALPHVGLEQQLAAFVEAPVQAVVMNITDGQAEYCRKAAEFLKNQGLRVELDLRNEKVGFKIREHTLQRVPYLLVAGAREAGSNTLAVRTRSGKDLGAMPLEDAIARLRDENIRRVVRHKPKPLAVAGSSGVATAEDY